MAILSDADRAKAWAKYMSTNGDPINIVKADLRSFIDYCDNFINSGQTSFNSNMPSPAKEELTAKQKAFGLVVIINERFNLGIF